MKTFNNKLEVGQLAMIIGCRKESTRQYIGTVVTVEEFIDRHQEVTMHYDNPPHRVQTSAEVVRVSGYQGRSQTDNGVVAKVGVGFFSAENLMPLPPLEEKEIAKEKELEYS